ncbi:MAG TPA: hypothetical protein VNW93_05340 [Mycobacterium sp.]|nr:hypothetical protein [Mycobacterium sp.]
MPRPSPPKGTLNYIAEARRRGDETKVIAREIGMTPHQVTWYLRVMGIQKPINRPQVMHVRNIADDLEQAKKTAAAILRHEIGAARAEAERVPAYKPGPLEW